MKGEVFLDSGAFIAFLDGSDASHEAVAALFDNPPPAWSSSCLVVAETHGWFLHRLGEQASRAFLKLLSDMPGLSLWAADGAHHIHVCRKLDRLRGKKLTYVDASSLVLIRERRIETVWGTDGHLAIEGATVVPGPPGH